MLVLQHRDWGGSNESSPGPSPGASPDVRHAPVVSVPEGWQPRSGSKPVVTAGVQDPHEAPVLLRAAFEEARARSAASSCSTPGGSRPASTSWSPTPPSATSTRPTSTRRSIRSWRRCERVPRCRRGGAVCSTRRRSRPCWTALRSPTCWSWAAGTTCCRSEPPRIGCACRHWPLQPAPCLITPEFVPAKAEQYSDRLAAIGRPEPST